MADQSAPETEPDDDDAPVYGVADDGPDEDQCPLSDAELLNVLKAERQRSVGFEHDAELVGDRENALDYYKGVMRDVPSLPNRSKAVDSTVAEVTDTLLPDLMEIFAGGDDVATFRPRGPEDEDAAQQETDYVNFVVFEQNDGWRTLATAFKDALLTKLGVFAWYWKNAPADQWECFKGKTQGEVAAILEAQGGAQQLIQQGRVRGKLSQEKGDGTEPLYDVEVQKEGPDGQVCIMAWPSEDFTVGRDTVTIAEATYCAGRSRPRAQELKAQGYDPDEVDRLPDCNPIHDTTRQARDNAGESEAAIGGDGANKDMRQVEVVDHFIRLLNDENELELWRVKTGGDETILLAKERVERVHYDTITPDIAAHRLYGRSIYDIVGELQRIKTALTRGWLDSIYYALNARLYVDETKIGDYTLSDLQNNTPGGIVRGLGENAVSPLNGAPIQSGTFSSGLEYFSTQVEQRTGVVRNAQGLNPDTLHDTAQGAQMLMTAAQKRVRMIARIFAETGVKGLFLGVHALLREHASKQAVVRLRGKWVNIDPTTWGERNDMTIELGLGSGGRAQDVAILNRVLELQAEIAGTPYAQMLLTPQNAYAALTDLVSKSGSKKGAMYFTDPSTVPPQPQQPHPEVVKAQIEGQTDQMKAQVEGQVKAQAAQQKAGLEAQVAEARLALQREQMDRETQLKQQEIVMDARVAAFKAAMGGHGGGPRVEYGGRPG
jgi:hypothetical protein